MTPPETPEGFTFVDKRGRDQETSDPRTREEERRDLTTENPGTGGDPRSRPDLSALFLMLASSALIHLGEQPDSSASGVSLDLGQARYVIELLTLLQEKTAGNRTAEESQLLEAILYDLRMRFVQRAGER